MIVRSEFISPSPGPHMPAASEKISESKKICTRLLPRESGDYLFINGLECFLHSLKAVIL